MRADAARNHERVLRAAEELLTVADDPTTVTMDAVAAAAGVGKGTLFRRFGDRVGLLQALHAERSEGSIVALRGRLADEPDPVERAVLLVDEVVGFKIEHRAITLALEAAGHGSPYDNPGYEAWHALLVRQVEAARGPHHAAYLAHALLAATRSDLVDHLRDLPADDLRAGAEALVRATLRHGAGTGS